MQLVNDVFKITRQYLFALVAERFDYLDRFLSLKQNRKMIIDVFADSSRVAGIIEREIGRNSDYSTQSFNDLWYEIRGSILNDSFREYIDSYLRERIYYKIHNKTKDTLYIIAISLLKKIALYHNNIIEKNFITPWFNFSDMIEEQYDRPQTFLSYAYFDKGLSLALFLYFRINGGFLYVNWMWSGSNPSSITKAELERALSTSKQLLFLRTVNSDLDYYGNSQIRQWCSWEIGNYYTKNNKTKYYLSFYGRPSKNDLLETFEVFHYVKNGIING